MRLQILSLQLPPPYAAVIISATIVQMSLLITGLLPIPDLLWSISGLLDGELGTGLHTILVISFIPFSLKLARL